MGNKNKQNHSTGVQKTALEHTADSQDYSSLKIVLFYCSMIVFLPVLTFFSLKSLILDTYFTLTDVRANIFSAVGAVVALHIALGFYIYRAYFGGSGAGTTTRKATVKVD